MLADRFERFAKALIAVPKSEKDKWQAECERRKKLLYLRLLD
jgi:hypothetical protein